VKTHYTLIAVFIAGLVIGWSGRSWLAATTPAANNTVASNTRTPTTYPPAGSQRASSQAAPNALDTLDQSVVSNGQASPTHNRITTQTASNNIEPVSESSALNIFTSHLNARRYREAISLYQELDTQGSTVVVQLKSTLLGHLETLTSARRYNDFYALLDQYLSTYYDDVEVLLLLADFHHANGSYLEVVDTYLLAKTYAYNDIDHQKVLSRFNAFVEDIDRWYSSQGNWLALISFYSHITTAGLMTSTHQYRQALAHLRSGDQEFAVAQFNFLLGDSIVGELAAQALDNLAGHAAAPAIADNTTPEYSESIALQRVGNQYAATLSSQRQEKINLLIDTGASMTAMSSASFHALGISADAKQQSRRVFRTAGGVVMGTVYTVAELKLGPYVLRNTEVAVIDFQTRREIDGLLGMNILGQFRFQIDQENARLRLSEK
jgi:clan AA aspartic protease (TIGR02281 family)